MNLLCISSVFLTCVILEYNLHWVDSFGGIIKRECWKRPWRATLLFPREEAFRILSRFYSITQLGSSFSSSTTFKMIENDISVQCVLSWLPLVSMTSLFFAIPQLKGESTTGRSLSTCYLQNLSEGHAVSPDSRFLLLWKWVRQMGLWLPLGEDGQG